MNIADHQLGVALTWARRGCYVVPCHRVDKGALVAGWGMDVPPERTAKFRDPAQIHEWWTGRYRRCHVGILTGHSGLVVVDLDSIRIGEDPIEHDRYGTVAHGSDVLEYLMRQAGADWPDTYSVSTPSHGKVVPGAHLVFRAPDGPAIPSAIGDGVHAPHLGPLVDIKAGGSYVIAAGSYSTAQGRPYARVSPPGLVPQPLPDWLLALLRRPAAAPEAATSTRTRRWSPAAGSQAERAAHAALESAVATVGDTPEGDRNRILFSRARWLGELSATAPRVLTEAAVADELAAAAVMAGLAEADARRTIRSGWQRGTTDGTAGTA